MEQNQKPLSFDEWKETTSFRLNDKLVEFMKRQYDEDYKKSWEDMLQAEYSNYLMDFNGNWLL
jgi:hypothetical protein